MCSAGTAHGSPTLCTCAGSSSISATQRVGHTSSTAWPCWPHSSCSGTCWAWVCSATASHVDMLTLLQWSSSSISGLLPAAELVPLTCLLELTGIFAAMSVDFWQASGKELAQPSIVGGLSPGVLWTYRCAAQLCMRSGVLSLCVACAHCSNRVRLPLLTGVLSQGVQLLSERSQLLLVV